MPVDGRDRHRRVDELNARPARQNRAANCGQVHPRVRVVTQRVNAEVGPVVAVVVEGRPRKQARVDRRADVGEPLVLIRHLPSARECCRDKVAANSPQNQHAEELRPQPLGEERLLGQRKNLHEGWHTRLQAGEGDNLADGELEAVAEVNAGGGVRD